MTQRAGALELPVGWRRKTVGVQPRPMKSLDCLADGALRVQDTPVALRGLSFPDLGEKYGSNPYPLCASSYF